MSSIHQKAASEVFVPSVQKSVLRAFCDHACGSCGVAWPSVETIAIEAGCCERAAHKAISALIASGHLTLATDRAGGRGRSAVYRVLADRVGLDGRPCRCSLVNRSLREKGAPTTPFTTEKGAPDSRKGARGSEKGAPGAPEPFRNQSGTDYRAHTRERRDGQRRPWQHDPAPPPAPRPRDGDRARDGSVFWRGSWRSAEAAEFFGWREAVAS